MRTSLKEHEKAVHRHQFKPHEWLYIKTKKELIALLRQYKEDFSVTTWTQADILHFLELYHYLYPGFGPELHHVRCIYTILSEVDL